MRLVLLALPVLAAGCFFEGGGDCTLIGCMSQLHLTVVSAGEPVAVFNGTITVDGTTFDVDCGGDAEPTAEVSCGDGEVTLQINAVEGGGAITYALHGPGSADSGSSIGGSGSTTPSWTSSQPNGPDCGPTCWSGEGSLELFESP